MLFRFRPPQDAEHSRPLDDCVSWWRDRRDHLLAYARLKALDDLDAEDLLAESVKRIIRAVADKRLKPEPDELTPYAFTVIRNTAIDWRKKRSNRLNVEQAYVLDPTVREDALFSLPEDTDHLHRELQKRLAQLPAELTEIISADYERMKGKWIRLRNEAGREFRICLDDLAPDDIDHLLDWKEHNGIRTWEYVAESGRPGFASPPFDGMLVDTRPQEDGSLEAVIRKTNGDIRIMPAKWQDTETRQYAAAWKHPSPMKEDNEKLRTFPSWRQARARSECANIPAVAFVLGKKGGPEEAEFKKQILGKPEEIARLNRTSAVVVCYHGQWDSCGREVFLQLHCQERDGPGRQHAARIPLQLRLHLEQHGPPQLHRTPIPRQTGSQPAAGGIPPGPQRKTADAGKGPAEQGPDAGCRHLPGHALLRHSDGHGRIHAGNRQPAP